jgi:hypothetical protein
MQRKALLLEVTAIVAFGYGFDGYQSIAGKPQPPRPGHRLPQRLPANVPQKARQIGHHRPANVISIAGNRHPVIDALAKVGRPVSNRELARLMGVTDGEASKRWQEVVHVGRSGKRLEIALRETRRAIA